jgi:predicted nucleotidyltransferase
MSEPDGPAHDLRRLIEVLDRHGVEYLLVGGAAANAHGAERPTEDADCVVRRERANLDRLAGALRELNARLRVGGMTDGEARTLPVQIDGTALDMAGMTTWMTDAGPFDVLAGLEAPDGRLLPYEELVERAAVFQGDGFVIRTAAIDDIINAKERADRPKDREALPELREIREREHRDATQGERSGP